MAKKKRHSTAEIEAKLREADTLAAHGRTHGEIAKTLGISVMTFHRWRKARPQGPFLKTPIGPSDQSLAMPTGRMTRISELQLENTRLRKLVTDLLLEKMRLEDDQLRPSGRTAKRA